MRDGLDLYEVGMGELTFYVSLASYSESDETEDERRQELRNNPRQVTNKAAKGKYKFMQKYYHRGAFFMEKEEGIYKRDYSSATLEDNFDKTVLPKVMQVKN